MSEVFEGLPVKSISIENLVNQRAAILERVAGAIGMLEEAAALGESSGISGSIRYRGFEHILGGQEHYRGTGLLTEKAIEGITKRLDASAWQHLLHESGIRTLMDAKARRDWDEKIEKADVPELTNQNIRSTFGLLYDTRGEIFERGVINCFKALSWSYKTNRPFAFGKRLVRRFIRGQVISKRGGGGTSLGYVNMRSTDELDDLSRVFHVLDGKPEPDHRQGWYSRLTRCDKTTDPDAEDDYMRVRSFRNGNGHVTFKRQDLVDRMNQIIAKHYPGALPENPHEEAESFEPVKVS